MMADSAIVKNSLVNAVSTSHLEHSGLVAPDRKERALQFLTIFHNIFTTNYDLLVVTRFRRHKSTSSLKLFERKRAHLVKMTVPAHSIVKTLNVIKHV